MKQFGADARMHSASEYQHVFANGKRRVDRYFVVIATPNRKRGARLGMAIAKRRAKRAVERNRIKRVIRESFRLHRHVLPDVDIVILARSQTALTDNQRLLASLTRHWQRISEAQEPRTHHG